MRGNLGWAFKRPWRESASEPAAFPSAFEMNTLIVGISVFWSSISYARELLWKRWWFAAQQSLSLTARVRFRNHPGNEAPMNASGKCLTPQNCSLRFFSLLFSFSLFLLLLLSRKLSFFYRKDFFLFSPKRKEMPVPTHRICAHL